MVGLPVRLERPVAHAGEKDQCRVLAGAHVTDRRWPLAVAGQPGGGESIEWHSLGPAGEHRLGDAGPPKHALDSSDVEVLARVRAGHDRQLGWREVELVDTAGLDEADEANGLDGRPQGHEVI